MLPSAAAAADTVHGHGADGHGAHFSPCQSVLLLRPAAGDISNEDHSHIVSI